MSQLNQQAQLRKRKEDARWLLRPSLRLTQRFSIHVKPALCPEGKIIFAPLAPFDVFFCIIIANINRFSHPKKSLLSPLVVRSLTIENR